MTIKFRGALILIYLSIVSLSASYAQLDSLGLSEEDQLLLDELLSLDSVLINELVANSSGDNIFFSDSTSNNKIKKHNFTARAGYNSSIVNAGRTLGLSQRGYNSGVSYFNILGLYADLGLYWNTLYKPKHYLTLLSGGYMGQIKKINYSVNYERYFYGKTKVDSFSVSFPYKNALSTSFLYDLKNFNFNLSYSFYFGALTAHRINLSGGYSLKKEFKKPAFINKFRVSPMLTATLGDRVVYYFNQTQKATKAVEKLTRTMGKKNFEKQYQKNKKHVDKLINDSIIEEEQATRFGIMNIALSIPVYIYHKNLSIGAMYQINFPFALKGEEGLDTSPNSYFNLGVYYSFNK